LRDDSNSKTRVRFAYVLPEFLHGDFLSEIKYLFAKKKKKKKEKKRTIKGYGSAASLTVHTALTTVGSVL
jgi:hypothetical protein